MALLPVGSTKAASKPVIGVSTAYTEKAETMNMAVFIESDEPIAAGSFDIHYDSSFITFQVSRVALGETLLNLPLISLNASDAGKLAVSWAQLKGQKIQGTVLEFPARVVAAGVGEVIDFELRNVQLFNDKGKEISAESIHGQIKPFDGEEKEYGETVSVDKEWTIHLSEPYNSATLNEHAVTMKRGTIMEEVIVTPLTSRSFSVKAKEQFRKTKYTLEITDQLRSVTGGKLKEPVRHTFTVR